MAPRVRVVAALIRRGGSVLVQQRREGSARALLWEFPGGKPEPGESDQAGLKRECREELGVEVAVGREVARTLHAYPDLEVELVLYSATIVEGEPRALHAAQLAFAPVASLPGLRFCEADVPFVERIAAGRM